MPRLLTLSNVTQEDLSILAGCIGDEAVDRVAAAGEADFIRAITETEGPWITALR
jgi:hypothetical protein